MQARNYCMPILAVLFNALLAVCTVSVLGFLKLLKTLSYAFHQFGYLATAKH